MSEREIMAEAHRARLNQGLLALAEWCTSRAMSEHDDETTLTMLEKKAGDLRWKCTKAAAAALKEK